MRESLVSPLVTESVLHQNQSQYFDSFGKDSDDNKSRAQFRRVSSIIYQKWVMYGNAMTSLSEASGEATTGSSLKAQLHFHLYVWYHYSLLFHICCNVLIF